MTKTNAKASSASLSNTKKTSKKPQNTKSKGSGKRNSPVSGGSGGLGYGRSLNLKLFLIVGVILAVVGGFMVYKSSAASSNNKFVTEMYQRCYNQMKTSGSGYDYWLGRLNNGEDRNTVWSAFVAAVAKNSGGNEVCQHPYPPIASNSNVNSNTKPKDKKLPSDVTATSIMTEAENRLILSNALVINSQNDLKKIREISSKDLVSDKDLKNAEKYAANTIEWMRQNGNLINDVRSYLNQAGADNNRLNTITSSIEANQSSIATNSAMIATELAKATDNNTRANKLFSSTNENYPSGQCGGDLPPCWVMQRESKGDIRIWNGGCYAPVGWAKKSPCGTSSASGKWQFVRGTWASFGGYLNAADAPEKVQDDKARQLWDNGRGCGHWNACR